MKKPIVMDPIFFYSTLIVSYLLACWAVGIGIKFFIFNGHHYYISDFDIWFDWFPLFLFGFIILSLIFYRNMERLKAAKEKNNNPGGDAG